MKNKKRIISLILLVGILLGAVGATVAVILSGREDPTEVQTGEQTGNGDTDGVNVGLRGENGSDNAESEEWDTPIIEDRPAEPEPEESAELEFDVGGIVKDPNPFLVDSEIEYVTKEEE